MYLGIVYVCMHIGIVYVHVYVCMHIGIVYVHMWGSKEYQNDLPPPPTPFQGVVLPTTILRP